MKLLSRKTKLKLDKTKKYLLGCSGGPDSMALFGMLLSENYNFEVAFVNYKTRKESDLEQKLVEDFCKEHGIICHFLEKELSSAGNFEHTARIIRYKFFREIIKNDESLYGVLIAHNADDLIETYLMQITRKNLPTTYGLEFTSSYADINIYRPLLGYEKNYLENYCKRNKIPYSIDITNFDEKYERNKIRSKLKTSMSRKDKEEFLVYVYKKNRKLKQLYKSFDKYIDGPFATIINKNIEVLQRFLFYFVKKQGNYLLEASYKNILSDIIHDKTNKLYTFDNFCIVLDSEGLTFLRRNPELINYKYNKEEFNKIGVCNFEGEVSIRPLKNFEYFNLNGHRKKVSRFFIDCKIPLSIRLIWPCVCIDNNKIIYVPRYRKNYKISEQSKLVFSTKTLQNLNIF